MFLKFVVRDIALLVLCLGLWQFDLLRQAQGGGWLLIGLEILTAAVTLVVSFLVHEWGHLIGALLTRSKVYAPHGLFELFLFHFDGHQNNARQFIAMSIGGFIASGLMMIAVIAFAPLHSLDGKLALVFVAIGIIATVVLEFPTTWRVARGAPLPSGPVYEPFDTSGAAGV
jgi:membrane-associated protease RseP (regulator of RpoE activity)